MPDIHPVDPPPPCSSYFINPPASPSRPLTKPANQASTSFRNTGSAMASRRTTELKRSLQAVGSTLLDRARRAGVVRPDLAATDLVPLMCGIAYAAQVHSGTPTDRATTARRYLTTLLDGLRTPAPRG